MRISDLVQEAFGASKNKGFHEDPSITFGDRVALCHSELSEALEAYRAEGHFGEVYEVDPRDNLKPVGVPSELADTVIRIADLCGTYGIDLEKAIRTKLDYNQTRPHKHGKRF